MGYSRNKPLGDIIKSLKGAEAVVTVDELARHRFTGYPTLYPKFLMACEGDQVDFLLNLWDQFVPDDDIRTMWAALVKAGFIVELLDTNSGAARDLVSALQYAIDQTKVIVNHDEHVCRKCRRLRR